MGRGNSQQANQGGASNLLYGPRPRGSRPDSKAGALSFAQLLDSLDQSVIPLFLRRALPGLFLTRAPSVYKHIDLPDSRVHEYRLARRGYEGELVVAFSKSDTENMSITYQDSDTGFNSVGPGFNDVGPGSETEQTLLASLKRNIAEEMKVDFVFNSSDELNQFLEIYRPCSLRLGVLRYVDNSSQEERFQALAEDFKDYLTSGPQLAAASSLDQLLTGPFGQETLGTVADNSLLCLEADLNDIAKELGWDGAS